MKRLHQLREEICRIGKLLHTRGYVAATDGNISVRVDDCTVLATPRATSKGMMQPVDLVLVDSNGERLARQTTRCRVSTEIAMHLMIYKMRPEIRAVVHAHPPTATGFALAGVALDQMLVPEVIVALGKIPLAPYATPGTEQLCESLAPLIPQHDAILMANHGVVTCGEDLRHAYLNMEKVEHFAQVVLVASQVGHPLPLVAEESTKLASQHQAYLASARAVPARRRK